LQTEKKERGIMAEIEATVHYGGNDFFIGISPGGHALTIETNGARSSAATPIELLLLALGGCTGSDIVGILRKKRAHITDYRIELRAERRTDFPRSFKTIQLRHIIKGRNLSEAAVKHAIALSDSKYCSVAASLRPTVEISVSYEIAQEEPVQDPVTS
jgi:putative redox protein